MFSENQYNRLRLLIMTDKRVYTTNTKHIVIKSGFSSAILTAKSRIDLVINVFLNIFFTKFQHGSKLISFAKMSLSSEC